jgi:hypothetical protein
MARTEDSHVAKSVEVGSKQVQDFVDQVDTALPEPMVAVPVRNESPALGTWQSRSLSAANPVALLLPQDARRRSAVILADAPVVVCSSREQAQAANASASTVGVSGFPLAAGVPIPVHNKAACWVTFSSDKAPASGGVAHVSVLVEKDDE